MIGVDIQYQPLTDTINHYNEVIGNSTLILVAYKRNTSRLLTRWKAALRVEPPAASNFYKLPWKSRKQQIFVILMLKRRGNFPYSRTHDLINAWMSSIDPAELGGLLRVFNIDPASIYVYGDFDTERQPMFVKIPWINPFDVSAPFMDEADEVLAQTFHTIAGPTAGVFD